MKPFAKLKMKTQKAMGKQFKEIREELSMPQDVVIEYLKDMKVHCSKPNLSKIENGLISCRADILGALCIIYEIKPETVLYK